MKYKIILSVVCAFFLTQSASAALPGQIYLKHGYELFTFSTRSPQLYQEYEKYYYKGFELPLSDEDLLKFSEEEIEKKSVKGIDRHFIEMFLEKHVVPVVNQEVQGAELTYDAEKKMAGFSHNIAMGQSLEMNLAVEMIVQALENNIDEVTLPVKKEKPELHIPQELKDLGIKEIMSSGVSDFSGSTDARIFNIERALEQFHGVLLSPGQEFSFNTYLGEVEGYTGYKKELVIKGPALVSEWGGGVCQVSSTLYRSVMTSGMPIVERANHSFSVDYYYPSGSDATIYPGIRDFRFVNNKETSVIIHTYRKENKLYFILLGQKEVESVYLFGPYVTSRKTPPPTEYWPSRTLPDGKRFLISHAVPGFVSTWYRVVKENKEEMFTSFYQARPRVYKVGGLDEKKIGSL